MAKIKYISFASVGKNEGCLCDRCGQYIKNIVTVGYADGLTLNYGQDCFDKLWKGSNLNDQGRKLFRKALKRLKEYQSRYERWQNDSNCEEFQKEFENYRYWQTYWQDHTFEEFKEWIMNECFPKWIADAQKELDRFSKVEFPR